jgi:hypothetical protein
MHARHEQILVFIIPFVCLVLFVEFLFQFLRLLFVRLVLTPLATIPATRFQLLLISIRRVAHSSDSIVLRRQTIGNTAMKGFGRFFRGVHID